MEKWKELRKLTIEELNKNPIWEYELKNDIEDIRIANPNKISEYDKEVYIIKTEFKTNDNDIYYGYSSPQDNSGLDYVQPVIIFKKQHVKLWYEKPLKKDMEKIRKVLAKTEEMIFPIYYKSLIKIDNEEKCGIIDKIKVEES